MYLWCALATPVPLALFVPIGLVALGQGISQPGAQSAAFGVRPDVAGSAAGIMGFVQWLVAAAASQLVGMSQDGTVWPVIHFVTFFSVLSLIFYVLARWSEAREQGTSSEPEGRS